MPVVLPASTGRHAGLRRFGLRPQYLLPLGVHPEIQLKFDTPVLLLTSGLAGGSPSDAAVGRLTMLVHCVQCVCVCRVCNVL